MCVTTNPVLNRQSGEEIPDPKQYLAPKLKKLLQDVEIQSK